MNGQQALIPKTTQTGSGDECFLRLLDRAYETAALLHPPPHPIQGKTPNDDPR